LKRRSYFYAEIIKGNRRQIVTACREIIRRAENGLAVTFVKIVANEKLNIRTLPPMSKSDADARIITWPAR